MKVVIAHGSFGKPHENWIPWLEDELDKLNIEYLTPTFPTPNHQNYNDWERVLNLYRDFGCFDSDTIFVGHSCGAIFLVKYLIENEINCKAIITASGYNNFLNNDELMDSLNASFYMPVEQIKKIVKLAKNRVAIHSDNDPFIPQEILKEFSQNIGAKEIVVHNGGHLNKSSGITAFPVLLEEFIKLK